ERVAEVHRESGVVPIVIVERILEVPSKLDSETLLDAPVFLSRNLRPQQTRAGHDVAAGVADLKAALVDQGLPVSFGQRSRNHVRTSQSRTRISEVVDVDNGIAIGLVEAVRAHIAPVRQQRWSLYHVRPLVAGESGVVVVGAARETEGVGVAALERLDPGYFISAEDRIQQSASVHELLPLADGQLISCVGDKPMVAVVAGSGFLQTAVLNRRNAGTVIVVVLAVNGLGECVESAISETIGHALLDLQSARVEAGMPEV